MKNLIMAHHMIEKVVENLHGIGEGEANGYADKYEFK